ncbi:MAG TPA: hypothetical protein VGA89_02460 [Patescibacteria group bacterium]|jgi:hypothetical protein
MMYLARPFVALIAKGVEIATKKEVSADIKVGTSILIGALVPSLIELGVIDIAGNHVADPLDVLGPLVAASWALGSWKIITSEKLATFKEELYGADSEELKLMFAGLWASVSEKVIDGLFEPVIESFKSLIPIKDKILELFVPTQNVDLAISPTNEESLRKTPIFKPRTNTSA